VTEIRPLNYELVGADAEIGTVIPLEEWTELAQIPHPRGGVTKASTIEALIGVKSKSWDMTRFGDLTVAVDAARRALAMAEVKPAEIDAVVVVTCTPYEIMLDQDAFRILRELGIADRVVPLQIGAGCAGLARAMTLLAQLNARRALIVTYNLVSPFGLSDDGRLNRLYFTDGNTTHPQRDWLWLTGALFSDAAAALVVQRSADSDGFAFYSRDSQSFGDEPGFTDPLIHYLGGGVAHPPGTPGAEELSCFGMNGPQVRRYYEKGMMLNHADLERQLPGYVDRVRRIYTHQANPKLVEHFAKLADLPIDKAPTNARDLGNLVSASTAKLLHDDIQSGAVGHGDAVCFSVVGAGPERGAFVLPVGESVKAHSSRERIQVAS
jgi:3-oxoacyl-[acyl-carrier-protein] synthase-3